MKREFSSISHLIDNRNRRNAWIGGIGTIAKQIFGTLDETDGLMYEAAIQSLQNNQQQLTSLMKQNILVTSSVLTSYNNTLCKIKDNEIRLNIAIDKFSLTIQNFSQITSGLIVFSHVYEIISYIETAILTLSFQVEDVVNGILFSNRNTLHPSIITPSQLYRELADNYRHLPNDLELPVSLNVNSMYLIFNISKLSSYYVSNKIIFILQVPLVNTKEYVLFHSLALPTPHIPNQPDSFSLIIPSSKYIAMTKDKSQYCTFDNLDICKFVDSNNLICDIENVYSTDAKFTCESELLAKVISEKPPQCESKIVVGKVDIWKPLSNNRWIYIQSEPNKITIDCRNSKLYEKHILGTGIITISKDCIGYCKSTTLIPKYNFLNVTSPINNFPDFDITNATCCNVIRLRNLSANVSHVALIDIDLDDLNSNNKVKMDSLLNTIKSLEQLQTPHILKYGTHYSILSILSFIFTIIVIVYVVFTMCKSGSNRLLPFKIINISPPQSTTLKEHTPEIELTDIQTYPSSSAAPLRTKV